MRGLEETPERDVPPLARGRTRQMTPAGNLEDHLSNDKGLPLPGAEGAVSIDPPLGTGIAEKVISEYERLLEAVPTIVNHLARVQSDTEGMAAGLEARVRKLATGYQELNELAAQAPEGIMQAAHDYAQALQTHMGHGGSHWVDACQVQSGGPEELDAEAIHRELFSMREAALAVDRAVNGEQIASYSHLDKLGTQPRRGFEHAHQQQPSARTRTRRRGRRERSIGAGQAGDGEQRKDICSRMDPNAPLTVPKFPGHATLCKRAQVAAGVGAGAVAEAEAAHGSSYHGYFVAGGVVPRQRQSHGLAPELRAIMTIPKPERLPGAAVVVRRWRRPREDRRASGARAVQLATGRKLTALEEEQGRARRVLQNMQKEMDVRERRLRGELHVLAARRACAAQSDEEGRVGARERPAAPAAASRVGGVRAGESAPRRGVGEGEGQQQGREVPGMTTQAAGEDKGQDEGDEWYKVLPVSRQWETTESGHGSPPRGGTGPRAQQTSTFVQTAVQPPPRESVGAADGRVAPIPEPTYQQAVATMATAGGLPPPPLVLSGQGGRDGMGANRAWLPQDDSGLVARLGAGQGGGVPRTSTRALRQLREGQAPEDGEGEGRLLLAGDDYDGCSGPGEGGGGGGGGGGTGIRVAGAVLAPPARSSGAREREERRAQTASLGLVALKLRESRGAEAEGGGGSGSAETAGSPVGEAEKAPEGGAGAAAAAEPRWEAAASLPPELMELMRVVVGQQQALAEDRKALLQALHTELEQRRQLLGEREALVRDREEVLNQDQTHLRERRHEQDKLELERLRRLEQEKEEEEEKRTPPPAEQDVPEPPPLPKPESQQEQRLEGSDGAGEAGGAAAVQEQRQHQFRSHLGRVLAGGPDYQALPLMDDNDNDNRQQGARPRFATSLGGALAGGGSWLGQPGNAPSANEVSPVAAHRPTGVDGMVYGGAPLPSVQEVLWDAGRGPEGEAGDNYAELAILKPASLLGLERHHEHAAKVRAEAEAEAEAQQAALLRAAEEQRLREGEAQVQVVDSAVQTLPPSREEAGRIQAASQSHFQASLATAVLSMAQRLTDMDSRATGRAERAEERAEMALEEACRAEDLGRQREDALLSRVAEVEAAAEERQQALRRALARVKDQTRLLEDRENLVQESQQQQQQSAPAAGGSHAGSDSSSSASDEVHPPPVDVSGLALLAQAAPVMADKLSLSRSSLSEGQINASIGALSEGELVTLSPRGRHVVEEGEVTANAAAPPSGRHQPALRNDPREGPLMLSSAHPRLRPQARAAPDGAAGFNVDPRGGYEHKYGHSRHASRDARWQGSDADAEPGQVLQVAPAAAAPSSASSPPSTGESSRGLGTSVVRRRGIRPPQMGETRERQGPGVGGGLTGNLWDDVESEEAGEALRRRSKGGTRTSLRTRPLSRLQAPGGHHDGSRSLDSQSTRQRAMPAATLEAEELPVEPIAARGHTLPGGTIGAQGQQGQDVQASPGTRSGWSSSSGGQRIAAAAAARPDWSPAASLEPGEVDPRKIF